MAAGPAGWARPNGPAARRKGRNRRRTATRPNSSRVSPPGVPQSSSTAGGRRHFRLFVRAELAQVERALVFWAHAWALSKSFKIACRSFSEPFHGTPVLGLSPVEGRALMGEGERAVVVNGDDEVPVLLGQVQFVQVLDAVPRCGPDDHRAVRVGLADHAQGLAEHGVPEFGRELLVRLIEDLEEHVVGGLLTVLGDLPPRGQEPLLVARRIRRPSPGTRGGRGSASAGWSRRAGRPSRARQTRRQGSCGPPPTSASRKGWRLILMWLKPASLIRRKYFSWKRAFCRSFQMRS